MSQWPSPVPRPSIRNAKIRGYVHRPPGERTNLKGGCGVEMVWIYVLFGIQDKATELRSDKECNLDFPITDINYELPILLLVRYIFTHSSSPARIPRDWEGLANLANPSLFIPAYPLYKVPHAYRASKQGIVFLWAPKRCRQNNASPIMFYHQLNPLGLIVWSPLLSSLQAGPTEWRPWFCWNSRPPTPPDL